MFRYIFTAAIEGATVLDCDAALVKRRQAALERLPPYPTTTTGPPIVVDVQDAPPIVYNFAVPAAPVFPCDVITWWSPPAEKELFRRTIDQVRDCGIDAPLMLAIGRARLSMPGAMDWLRRQIAVRQRRNGTLTTAPLTRRGPNRVDRFGHYTQQFGFSMAVGELLLQSVGDVIRVFPAWPPERAAEFHDLRARAGSWSPPGSATARRWRGRHVHGGRAAAVARALAKRGTPPRKRVPHALETGRAGRRPVRNATGPAVMLPAAPECSSTRLGGRVGRCCRDPAGPRPETWLGLQVQGFSHRRVRRTGSHGCGVPGLQGLRIQRRDHPPQAPFGRV